MEKKDFERRVDSAKAVAKQSAKSTLKSVKKNAKKWDKSKIIVLVLMVIWTVCSVLGTIGFIKSSAASSSKTETANSVSYEITPQGLVGLSLQNSGYEYSSNAYLIFEFVPTVTVYTTGNLSSITIAWEDYSEGSFTDSQYIYSTFADTQTVTAYPKIFNGLAGGYYSTYVDFRFYTNMTAETLDFLPTDILPLSINYVLYGNEKVTLVYEFTNDFIFYMDIDYTQNISGVTINTMYSPYLYQLNGAYVQGQPYYEFVTVGIDYPTYNVELENAREQGFEQAQDRIDELERQVENARANGYQDGYNAGLNDQNPYTLFNLVTAVVDVPIQAFTNLLDFEFLGFNLLNFAQSLLFLALLLVLLKLFMK